MELIASGTVTTLIANVSTAVSDTATTLWPIAAVVVGILLAFYVLRKVIGLFSRHTKA